MNEENKNQIDSSEQHPLHMLDNQADPDTKPKIILQKPIRTYESDIAEALARGKTSVTSMVIAENKKVNNISSISSTEIPKSNISKKIFYTLLSLIFIGAGFGGGYYLYLKSPLSIPSPTVTNTKIPSLISLDIQKILPKANIGKILSNESIQNGKTIEYILTQNIGSTTVKISSVNFIESSNLTPPDALKRSLTGRWVLGTYDMNDIRSSFIILSTDFFQNAYSGMLKWETVMPNEMATIFNYTYRKGKFEDKVVLNRDIRQYRSEMNEILLLYSFIDKDTLVITDSEATLKMIIEKIEKQNFIR